MAKTNKQQMLLWQERIQACEASNLSIKGWCRENSVNPSAYHYWFKKLNSKNENIETKWAEVKLVHGKSAVSQEQPIILHYHDFKIEIPRNFEKLAIAEVLSALRSIC